MYQTFDNYGNLYYIIKDDAGEEIVVRHGCVPVSLKNFNPAIDYSRIYFPKFLRGWNDVKKELIKREISFETASSSTETFLFMNDNDLRKFGVPEFFFKDYVVGEQNEKEYFITDYDLKKYYLKTFDPKTYDLVKAIYFTKRNFNKPEPVKMESWYSKQYLERNNLL
jgi:hypothetical protein